MVIIKKLVLSALLLACMTPVYADSDVRVYVNGRRIEKETVLINDTTYIPLRAVSESLGAVVSWDDATKSAFVTMTEDDLVAKVVSDISPSVVTIVGNYSGSSATVQYNNPTMHGSGVIYRSNGYIVTNAHVVKDIKNLTVVFSDGTLLPGKVMYSDELSDIAIVKADKIGLPYVAFASSDDIVSGRTAIAIGTPISLSMRNTVTKGIISGVDVSLPDSHYKLIQTDTTINPGNSGGPLLNINGELVGITTSKYTGAGIENAGFVIPVDTVSYIISQYEKNGMVLRPDVKITLEQSWEAQIGLPTMKGLTVRSSAEEGFLAGDVITSVNGIEVHSLTDWNEAIKDTYNGQYLTVSYTRNGQTGLVEIKKER